MSRSIAHRGPDDEGWWLDSTGRVGLAHRRLSIIDVSPSGHQPMHDPEWRAVLTFNGEIYNYRELRAELSRSGQHFTSTSDTEVLLHLYLREGVNFLQRLNGIFAFALWDTARETLLLARDGTGVKPLYWARTPDGFVFASELKALMRTPQLDRTIDPEAIAAHLGLLYAPGPRTMLRAARKLLPGQAMEVNIHGAVVATWDHYRLPVGSGGEQDIDVDEARRGVLRAVSDAVRRQLVADVPVGAFLSGGLDSSTVVHFARQHLDGTAQLPCFTVNLQGERLDGLRDDLPYARAVASRIGVPLHEVAVSTTSLWDLDRMVFHLDEPQPDPAALNAWHIARHARELGVKVLLSGTGGDDVFTGYRRHRALRLEQGWAWAPSSLRRALRAVAGRLPSNQPTLRRIGKLFSHADLPADERLGSYFLWLQDARVRALLHPNVSSQLDRRPNLELLLQELRSLPDDTRSIARMLQLDRRFFLPDHNLNYMDKMTMAAGIEVRTPLLDPNVLEIASRIPDRWLQRGREGKWILKSAMAPYLGNEVVFRSKTGFGAPLRRWLHSDLRPDFEEYLSSDRAREQAIFDTSNVRRLLIDDQAGRIDAAYPLYAVLCIDSWCRQFM